MPLHGVGIIVGGTIAVVGSGYAFKKFVYDPHLAPYIEAFIAQHPILHSLSPSTPTSPIPVDSRRAVPIPVSATSSARQSHLTHARQRRSVHRTQDAEGMDLELEMRQPLLRSGEREEYLLDPEGLDDWGRSRRATMRIPQDSKGKARFKGESGRALMEKRANEEETSTSHSLVDLAQEPVNQASSGELLYQDCEMIRSIIFDQDEASSDTQAHAVQSPSAVPPLSSIEPQSIPLPTEEAIMVEKGIEAVPTSISPPQSLLSHSWSVDIPIIQSVPLPNEENPFLDLGIPHNLTPTAHLDDFESDDESAMISRPHTAQSDYIDAESYTPLNDLNTPPTFSAFPSLTSSPQRRHRSPPPLAEAGAQSGEPGGIAAEMGLSFIRLKSPDKEVVEGSRRPMVRRSMSVISLSESDGGASDGWEAV